MVGDYFFAAGHHKMKKNMHGKTLNTLNAEKKMRSYKNNRLSACSSALLLTDCRPILVSEPSSALLPPHRQPRVCFEVLLDAVSAARGESGARVKERGFVLIIHRYRLTDRSQHAALWARAPAYRAQKKGGVREAVVE